MYQAPESFEMSLRDPGDVPDGTPSMIKEV